MDKNTITLYTMSWNGYWDKYGTSWTKSINNLNTRPDEILIVSDEPIDISDINHKNVKNIIADASITKVHANYRNLAAENSSCDWIVASDIDDTPLANLLDNLDDSADVYAFAYYDKDILYHGDEHVLTNRLNDVYPHNSAIPGASAIKRSLFDKIRYEIGVEEDWIFYSMCSKLNVKLGYDKIPRFIYSGWHQNNWEEQRRVSKIYTDVLKNNRTLYLCWFSKDMTQNRMDAIQSMMDSSGVQVVIITNENFFDYENKEIPIHEAFKYLSDVHKSAYARSYLMYFYGQGYSDIKRNNFDWNPYFDKLFLSKYDAIGYSEKHPNDIPIFWNDNKQIEEDVSNNYHRFAGNGYYIYKPKTQIAKEWLMELHNLLDSKLESLIKNPGTYHPYAIFGGVHYSHPDYGQFSNSKYPIEWNEICGRIIQKIQYEAGLSKFLLDMPYINMQDYR